MTETETRLMSWLKGIGHDGLAEVVAASSTSLMEQSNATGTEEWGCVCRGTAGSGSGSRG